MIVKNVASQTGVPVESEGARDVVMRLLIHAAEGAPNFYMRHFSVGPGGYTPWHSHAWEHEIYIIAGTGLVMSYEAETPVGAGDCVFVRPDEQHQVRNTGSVELQFLCLVPRAPG